MNSTLGAVKEFAQEIESELEVSETFTATGATATTLATAVRALYPSLT